MLMQFIMDTNVITIVLSEICPLLWQVKGLEKLQTLLTHIYFGSTKTIHRYCERGGKVRPDDIAAFQCFNTAVSMHQTFLACYSLIL